MKALTLIQPWATLIAEGRKRYETRSWAPPRQLVGKRIAIHAGATVSTENRRYAEAFDLDYHLLPFRAVVCTARLVAAHLAVSNPGEPGESVVYVCRERSINPERDPDWQADYSGIPTDEYGNYSTGRWAWRLTDIKLFDPPILARGHYKLWTWEPPEWKEPPI